MMSLGTVNSTCLPKTQPAGAGEIEGGRRTLYQSSFGSSGSFSSLSRRLRGEVWSAAPALGASSLSAFSRDLGRGTRFQPTISNLAPLSSFIRMLSLLFLSGENLMLVL